MRLTQKLLLLIAFSLFIVLVPFGIADLYRTRAQLIERSNNDISVYVQTISTALAECMWNFETATAKQLIISTLKKDNILQIELYDEKENLFFGITKNKNSKNAFDVITTPTLSPTYNAQKNSNDLFKILQVSDNEQLIFQTLHSDHAGEKPTGSIYLLIETSQITKDLYARALLTLTSMTILIFATGGLLFYFTRNTIIKPIQNISQVMESAANNLSARATVEADRKDEIQELSTGFNLMMDKLQGNQTLIHEQQKQILTSSKFSALGEMAAGIAHEINNPLAIIGGISSLLIDEIDDGAIDKDLLKTNLVKIEMTADRISKIIKGLKSFSRNAENDPFNTIRLSVLIDQTLALCLQRFKQGAIEIRIKNEENPELSCREVQLSQVMLNILNNTYDAIENLEQNKWVEISTQKTAKTFSILITDCGSGIPKHIVDKIMQPFYTTKEIGKGTGLGLSISKGIVEQHGGRLYIDTECANTRFVIELPIERLT